jgi:hypothetical protein
MDQKPDESVLPEGGEKSSQPGGDGNPAIPEDEARLRLSLELPAGKTIRLTAETVSGEDDRLQAVPLGTILVQPSGAIETLSGALDATILADSRAKTASEPRTKWQNLLVALPAILFALSLLVYLATRLIALPDFPIYFFTDEAVQTVLAADLIRDGLHGWEGDFLPTYFKNGNYYNLSLSVYLQVVPYLLFGKSVFVTRAVSVFTSLLAAFSVGLILRDFLKIPYWWSGVLLLSTAPAWFLHARTAFETVIFVSFYSISLYAYLLYRLRSPRFLYLTLFLAALAFYSYSPGQVVVVASGVLLLLVDAPYHWRNRNILWKGLLFGCLLTLPYLRSRLEHPEAALDQLRLLGSYWVQPLPLAEKLRRFGSIYLDGFNPGYWFLPNDRDLPRHLMKGYGNLSRLTMPFALLGLVVALSRLRRPEYRLVLVALLAAPLGSALVGVGITRLLVLVIPATLLIAVGISTVLGWLERPADALRRVGARSLPSWLERWRLPQPLLALGLFAILAAANFSMLVDALQNGPTWFRDYGMGGMQYGARQVFGDAEEYLNSQPDAEIILSPTWANGTDILARYFLGDTLPLQLGSVQGHIDRLLPLDDNTLFIATPEEYRLILGSEKFSNVVLERSLPYPDGSPGFYFVRLRYADSAQAIFAAEAEQRRQLQQAEVQLKDQTLQARHSKFDMGEIAQAFDGNPFTFVRTLEANPLVIELDFPESIRLGGLSLIIGSANVEITAQTSLSPDGPAQQFSVAYKGSVDQLEARLDFDRVVELQHLRIEVLDRQQPEPAHIHVWEISLDPQ